MRSLVVFWRGGLPLLCQNTGGGYAAGGWRSGVLQQLWDDKHANDVVGTTGTSASNATLRVGGRRISSAITQVRNYHEAHGLQREGAGRGALRGWHAAGDDDDDAAAGPRRIHALQIAHARLGPWEAGQRHGRLRAVLEQAWPVRDAGRRRRDAAGCEFPLGPRKVAPLAFQGICKSIQREMRSLPRLPLSRRNGTSLRAHTEQADRAEKCGGGQMSASWSTWRAQA